MFGGNQTSVLGHRRYAASRWRRRRRTFISHFTFFLFLFTLSVLILLQVDFDDAAIRKKFFVQVFNAVSFRFWRDLTEMLGAKRVHSVHASVFYLGANAMLTALQFIWARPVVRGVAVAARRLPDLQRQADL